MKKLIFFLILINVKICYSQMNPIYFNELFCANYIENNLILTDTSNILTIYSTLSNSSTKEVNKLKAYICLFPTSRINENSTIELEFVLNLKSRLIACGIKKNKITFKIMNYSQFNYLYTPDECDVSIKLDIL